jgi:hypothetical protein
MFIFISLYLCTFLFIPIKVSWLTKMSTSYLSLRIIKDGFLQVTVLCAKTCKLRSSHVKKVQKKKSNKCIRKQPSSWPVTKCYTFHDWVTRIYQNIWLVTPAYFTSGISKGQICLYHSLLRTRLILITVENLLLSEVRRHYGTSVLWKYTWKIATVSTIEPHFHF